MTDIDHAPPRYDEIVAEEFATEWYEATYGARIAAERRDGEEAFAYYLRQGAHLGHDPHPYFSEIHFRLNNPGIEDRLERDPGLFAFRLYVEQRSRHRPFTISDYRTAHLLRTLQMHLDHDFLTETHPGLKAGARAAAFYIRRSMAGERIDPHPEFSESYYLARNPDVRKVVDNGSLISGFQHYLGSGRREGRKTRSVAAHEDTGTALLIAESSVHLENNVPGVGAPVEIGLAEALAALTRPIEVRLDPAQPRRIHVFLMHYFPEIFFGGFAAFFDFMRSLKSAQGVEVKLYVSSDTSRETHDDNVARVARYAPKVAAVFDTVELLPRSANEIAVSPDCEVVSYSMETHFLAHQVARALKRRPYFFIQDDEAMFHPNDSIASAIYSAFDLPHFGIVNSSRLLEHFEASPNYPALHPGAGYDCVTFENRILPLKLDQEAFRRLHAEKTRRKLVFYGRPERHAARNQYAFVVTALRQAVAAGVFDEDWEFWSIGSLDYAGDIPLGGGRAMRQITRVSKQDYEAFIAGSDIGISMISTPHPGIIHYQMAAFGIVTLTNAGFARSPEVLTGVSGNILPVRLTFRSVIEALRCAVERAADHETRFRRARESRIESTDRTLRAAVDTVSARMTAARVPEGAPAPAAAPDPKD